MHVAFRSEAFSLCDGDSGVYPVTRVTFTTHGRPRRRDAGEAESAVQQGRRNS
jgi:hypothetical protein